jgi:signal transduction histidine kinase
MGWLELARDQAVARPDGITEIPTPLFVDVEREIASDLERLRKVASRFGHIGSLPALSPQDIVPIVASTVSYYRRRLPQQGLGMTLTESFDEDVPPINVNAELMGWVVENLVKNAIDASDAKTGHIDVSVRRRPESETVEISVKDNGRGIPPAQQRRVFEPGFTTRKRGWGLGLTLVRRIVEDYHGGRVELRWSVPGQGSEFVVCFPV